MSANTTLRLTPSPALTLASTSAPDEDELTDGMSQNQLIAVMAMLIVFSIFGTLGNGLVLYVFTRKSENVTSTIFILALAWTDFFTCLIILPFTMTNIRLSGHFDYDFVCKLYQFLITCNVPLSAFIMVAIAVDRYFSICHPFLHVVTPRRARVSILCLCMFAFSLGTITACMYGVYELRTENVTRELGEVDWCSNDTAHLRFGPGTTTQVGDSLVLNATVSSGEYSISPTLGNPSPSSASSSLSSSSDDISPSAVVEIVINNSSFQHGAGMAGSGRDNMTSGSGGSLGGWAGGERESPRVCTRQESSWVYNGGLCAENEIIFTEEFIVLYQKVYMSFFVISLLVVFTLYFFIYRSVVRRRAWRRKQKSWSHSPMTMTAAAATGGSKDTCKSRSMTTHTTLTTPAPGPENLELTSSGVTGQAVENCPGAVGDVTKDAAVAGSDGGGGGGENKANDKSGERGEDNKLLPSATDGNNTSSTNPINTTNANNISNSINNVNNANNLNNTATTTNDVLSQKKPSTPSTPSPRTTSMITIAKSGTHENGVETSALTSSAEKKTNRERRDFNFLANIRTAGMLFVVAIVFIFSFLPAWLMATNIATYQIFIFYMHFLYNVANPVIYAFMNQSFRKELKRVFQRGTHFLRSA
ncbi:uncharacterized protein LOC101854844 [Aplysia californica]|uniref:Uncharacterized protein LOC101854844 n=1 Tax=Aplysia californica TaxID=6500 RepID=A0ABM1AEL6_APLCA|nr:uncharacterized protein LOC101854844 [Aplysia californica]